MGQITLARLCRNFSVTHVVADLSRVHRQVCNIGREVSDKISKFQRRQSKTSQPPQTTSSLINHVIDWDQAKVIDRKSINKMDRWIKETVYLRKEHHRSMNRDEGRRGPIPINPVSVTVISMTSCSPQQRHLAANGS